MEFYIKKNRIILMLILLFPISITLTQYKHDITNSGINVLLFDSIFAGFNLFPLIFPIFIIALVSELNAYEWLSDIKSWSIIRIGYKKYIQRKITSTLIIVSLYVIIGNILALIFLGITHGFHWSNDSQIIAPGLDNIFGPYLTTFILLIIQITQAISYVFCSFWILQYTKRIWETIVYPFLLIVILPTLLFNLDIIPESLVPFNVNTALISKSLNSTGMSTLINSLSIWFLLTIFYAIIMIISLLRKQRRGISQ
ncbi:hypothetical protein [Bacillus mycoides]|uniref:hypothetical protein n=1 Tax=Bacillus mycoides TaxID=1405 RepID=UPI002E1E9A8D|nr:hypothetical protein [Bacillus mycoides]